MTTSDILAAVTPVVDALDRIGVRNHIAGSVASSVLGVARATLDVDLVADLRSEHIAAFVGQLSGKFYVEEEMVRDAVRRRACFNVIHLATMLKVDVFVLKTRPYDLTAFDRMTADTLEDEPGARIFYVASAEDTILNKLEWYRMGDGVSDRQWRDVIGVMNVQGRGLDFEYLRRWADELEILDLLERAVEQSGLE